MYVDRLDDQMFYTDVLEMDLDQHKDTLADAAKELAEKDCVIEAQEYLLFTAREDLANAIAEKDEIIQQSSIGSLDHEEERNRESVSSL